jgi:pimeloyl-ACP methyl ester carboxylesterase
MSNTITPVVFYRTLNLEGLEIFYREAGPQDAPTVLLLHGFPSSSHMFRNLIPMLAGKYHVVAPDFPGYGESSAPSVNEFEYSYERLASVTEKFTEKLNISSYAMYLSDIGASIGFRLAVMHNWVIDQANQDRPGNKDIQLSILYNAKRNLDAYPDWQKYFRKQQPPMLITWGKNDGIFTVDGAELYKRELPNAELHLLDTGHFALEEEVDRIGSLIREFLDRTINKK